jgi:hypothetical protein
MTWQDLMALWSLFWRSIIYLPLMLAVFALLVFSATCLATFPFLVILYIYAEFYATAAGYAVAWLLILAGWRYFRLARFLDGPFGGL